MESFCSEMSTVMVMRQCWWTVHAKKHQCGVLTLRMLESYVKPDVSFSFFSFLPLFSTRKENVDNKFNLFFYIL